MQPNSLDWLTVVGLPLTPDSVNPELISRLSVPSLIAVESGWLVGSALKQNNDYRCAQVGFDLLMRQGFQFVRDLPQIESYRHILSAPLWIGGEKRRGSVEVKEDAVHLLQRVHQEHDAEIWYITQGSPYFQDDVSEHLLKLGAKLIDTPSSAELAYAATGSTLPIHFPRSGDPAREGYANIFTAFGSYYPATYKLTTQLPRAKRIFAVSLGYQTVVRQLKAHEVNLLDTSLNSQTLILEI